MAAEHDAVALENRLERITTAIRTINEYHNLGDQVYDVRDNHGGDDGFTGNSWEHPKVKAYGEAVKTLVDEGVLARAEPPAWARQPQIGDAVIETGGEEPEPETGEGAES